MSKNQILIENAEEIAKSVHHSQLISEFGKRVTSELDIDQIDSVVHHYISSLIKIDGFGIGVYSKRLESIIFENFIDHNGKASHFEVPLTSTASYAVKAFIKNEFIVLDELTEEYQKWLQSSIYKIDYVPNSAAFVPLCSDKTKIGVLLVYSNRKFGFTRQDKSNLQTLASYISIAFDNAWAYRTIGVKNQSIENSIKYGRTIQKAILPRLAELQNFFDPTLIFLPRDIVSGDFYWSTDKGSDGVFVAVVDCTGHGVPGAFMSLIGSRLLNEIIVEEGITETSEILLTLHTKIKKALRQDKTDNNDGMDACLCRFVKKADGTYTVDFSGAKRPLWIFDTKRNQLITLNPDRHSIGGATHKKTPTFTTQSAEVVPGDIVYLSTDGFVDQNDVQRKRFGTENFVNLIEQASTNNFDSIQRTVIDAFEKFKGNEPQRDDITILALRIK